MSGGCRAPRIRQRDVTTVALELGALEAALIAPDPDGDGDHPMDGVLSDPMGVGSASRTDDLLRAGPHVP